MIPRKLHPDWTESETTKFVEVWRTLEPQLNARRRGTAPNGLDAEITAQLSRQTQTHRSVDAIQTHRLRVCKVIPVIRAFDTEQRLSGSPSWFNLSSHDKKQVKMTTAERKVASILTLDSYNKLLTIPSVKHRIKSRKKPQVNKDGIIDHYRAKSTEPESIQTSVRSWVHVLKQQHIATGEFANLTFEQAVLLFPQRNRPTMNSWRKMKRLVVSYQFIRAFDVRLWFQLSDTARIECEDLPADFENIGHETFDEIDAVDRNLPAMESGVDYDEEKRSQPSPKRARIPTPPDTTLPDQTPLQDAISQYEAELQSDEAVDDEEITEIPSQECLDAVNQQRKQFRRDFENLQRGVERDFRCSNELISSYFFDQSYETGHTSGAALVARLLDDYQQRITGLLTRFLDETMGEESDNASTNS